jgi:hypothetical protein
MAAATMIQPSKAGPIHHVVRALRVSSSCINSLQA